MREPGDKAEAKQQRRLAAQSGVGEEGSYNAGLAVFSYIVGGIIVWTLIGWWLDNLLGTSWIVLAGAFLGAAGGFYLSYTHGLTRRTGKSANDRTTSADTADGPQQ